MNRIVNEREAAEASILLAEWHAKCGHEAERKNRKMASRYHFKLARMLNEDAKPRGEVCRFPKRGAR